MADTDNPSRRKVLECMTWAGAAVAWTVAGGVPRSSLIGPHRAQAAEAAGGLTFMQISDSHIGFHAVPNMDTPGTLRDAIALVRQQRGDAALMIHTGDVSHLSADAQFDTARQLIGEAGLQTHYVPGEHDVLVDDGKGFFAGFTPGAPRGWYSFDDHGVHFIGLVNVANLKAGGLGFLGQEQLEWLEDDLKPLKDSTPIVVFAHIPLWSVYPTWGWGTDDAAIALGYLKRFGSVTVLNGHIHQLMQKVEGNVTFHTARSTAFPQPAPGTAPSPGPMLVPAEKLRSVLGITSVTYTQGKEALAISDTALADR